MLDRILFPDIDEFFLPHDSTSTLSQTLNKHFDHSPCLEVAYPSSEARPDDQHAFDITLSLLVYQSVRWPARTSGPRSSTAGPQG